MGDISKINVNSTEYNLKDAVGREALAALTAENVSQQAEINYAVNVGAKNILKITERSKEHNGVTFTVNSDESVSISGGTTSQNSFIRLTGSQSSTAYSDQVPIKKGKYKFSCPEAVSTDTFIFVIGYRESSSDTRHTLQANAGNGFANEFEITTDTGRFDATLLSYSTSQTYSATVYPMIRPAVITNPTYVPYAKTNAELTSEKQDKLPTEIPPNSNLNDYKAPGIYSVGSNMSTIINTPVTAVAYALAVYRTSTSSTAPVIQVATCLAGGNNARMLIRVYIYSTDTWGAWGLIGNDNFIFQSGARSAIISGTNLKHFTSIGRYRASSSVAGTLISSPTSSPFIMDVTELDQASTILQTIFDEDRDMYNRVCTDLTGTPQWTDWIRVTPSTISEEEIRGGTSTTQRAITAARLNYALYGTGTALSNGDDLNDTSLIRVTRGGVYQAATTAIAKTIKHRPDYPNPDDMVFRVEVKLITAGNPIMIMYTRAKANATTSTPGIINMYYRGYTSSGWSPWRHVVDEAISDYNPS